MTKGEIIRQYREMNETDQHAVDRWLKANLVVGSLMASLILIMALASSNSLGPEKAVAESPRPAISRPVQGLSPFDLMITAPVDLPVQQVAEPF